MPTRFEVPTTKLSNHERTNTCGGTAPCAFNAANEVAVAAFLESRIGVLDITTVVEETLSRIDGAAARDLEDLVVADAEARRLAARGLQPA